MRFLADESVDRQIVDRLRLESYRVDYVAEMFPGVTDDVVLQFANQDNAILITGDKDFGEVEKAFTVITKRTIRIRHVG